MTSVFSHVSLPLILDSCNCYYDVCQQSCHISTSARKRSSGLSSREAVRRSGSARRRRTQTDFLTFGNLRRVGGRGFGATDPAIAADSEANRLLACSLPVSQGVSLHAPLPRQRRASSSGVDSQHQQSRTCSDEVRCPSDCEVCCGPITQTHQRRYRLLEAAGRT